MALLLLSSFFRFGKQDAQTHRDATLATFTAIVAQHTPYLLIAGETLILIEITRSRKTTEATLTRQASLLLCRRHGNGTA
jgi:hypothetical protein